MCGIAARNWNDPEKAVEFATLQRMIDARHRGPDGEGTYMADCGVSDNSRKYDNSVTSGADIPVCLSKSSNSGRQECLPHYGLGVALGHRRLSIIDVAGGKQPLSNEDGTVWVVFNGEIYNFRDLRRRLEGAGHRFRTQSDTEVLVHLYEDEGPELLNAAQRHVRLGDLGRPAAAVAAGPRPAGQEAAGLSSCEPGRLLFASELKAILQVPGVPREIDPQALDEYLTYQYVPHPRTIFRGIAKLPPGHYAVYGATAGSTCGRTGSPISTSRTTGRPKSTPASCASC